MALDTDAGGHATAPHDQICDLFPRSRASGTRQASHIWGVEFENARGLSTVHPAPNLAWGPCACEDDTACARSS